MTLPTASPSFADRQDYIDADRGFIAALKPCVIKNRRGKTIWDNDAYKFVNETTCPGTANPKLWRQAQLLSKQGLYQISESIFQVRGFDISHISFAEADTGVIVIDPLISCECAAAAFKLYQEHRGVRPIKAIIYSHSHIDHYGGAAGLLPTKGGVANTDGVTIIAPEGFMEEAVSENTLLGPIMRHRAAHMYGAPLSRSPVGQIGTGLGMGTSSGTTSLVPPNVTITRTSQKLILDGVQVVFQIVSGTEAPAEMNMFFPKDRALLIAECAVHSLHNIITLRGALVRDAKAWSTYLDETLQLFCEDAQSQVLFASHGWPTWGERSLKKFIEEQRDLYAYLHDQTIRYMNNGYNGAEIAEIFTLPPSLAQLWHTQGFYGSLSHNIKGIYQRYLTWFDGTAENLWRWPPKEEGMRYIKSMGGSAAVLRQANEFIAEGDLRFAATLLGHIVAAKDAAGIPESDQELGRQMLADVFEKLGFGAENAIWRNFYLAQALELGNNKREQHIVSSVLANFPKDLSMEEWLAGLSISIDGEQAGLEASPIGIGLILEDTEDLWSVRLSRGALTYRKLGDDSSYAGKNYDLVVAMDKNDFQKLLKGQGALADSRVLEGDIKVLEKVLSFAGIEPRKAAGLERL